LLLTACLFSHTGSIAAAAALGATEPPTRVATSAVPASVMARPREMVPLATRFASASNAESSVVSC
jgi:hypothetical protein